MAKNSITDYDNTAANNTDVQSVDISEGCSPSGINNAIREVMADLADVNDGTVALTSPVASAMSVTTTLTAGGIDINGNELILDADGDTSITADTDDQIDFKTGGSDTMHLTSTGLGIGVASPARILDISTTGSTSPRLTGTSSNGAYLDFHNNAATTGRFRVGQGYGSGTDNIGFLNNEANAGIVFGTNNAEAMRIDSSGNLLLGKTTTDFNTAGVRLRPNGAVEFVRSADEPLLINRLTNDGVLVRFYQAGTSEGTISVSGTTVSYNGGHLSRWSRLADNTKNTSIVKGTVMTNLDQMVVWTDADGNTEENEQLNCMAVSSVEGDADVAGVFVNWDESDDYNDMNIAMTGDMVIRVASGTTVARGDLLMSAGDGTAKPQGDDIVRSKTIAKVTSTTVSHTYDDGSYLVPCVLMAC